MRRAFPVLLMVALAACAGSGTGQASQASREPSAAAPVESSAPTTSSSTLASPAEYATTLFQPPFAVTLPAGWTVAERAADVAQIYQSCASCPHGGEENGEITFDMALADVSPEDAIAELSEAANLEAADITAAQVGGLPAQMFVGTRTGTADVQFQASGYGSGPFGEPITVYALDAGGSTVTIFIDPHDASGDAAEAFQSSASQILDSLSNGD